MKVVDRVRGRAPIDRLFQPVDAASLALFRICFGVLMMWEVYRYFAYDWIRRYYITPRFHFTYYGFGWVAPWPSEGMFLHFAALALLAACIALGLFYRPAAILFFLGFTYVFLLEQARYLNHFYLIALIAFVLIWIPAHREWSTDALRRPPAERTAPAWALWLLRMQIAIPYVYAGLAKLNADWLRGYPLRAWMAERSGIPVIGPLLTHEWMVHAFVIGSVAIDFAVVPLVLWRRTRIVGLVFAALFHLLNAQLFTIGVFPPMMMAATLMFLPPDWPRRLLPARHRGRLSFDAAVAPRRRWLIAAALAFYALVQLLVPFRHLLYPGDVAWTEEGHRFSWRMKLRNKEGDATFIAAERLTGRSWTVDPGRYLARWQYVEMASRPDMILQFAHYLGRELRAEGKDVAIRTRVTASLNGRRHQPLIDPVVDLTAVPRTLGRAAWIVPLYERLPED